MQMRFKGINTYEKTTRVSFWKQPLFGVTKKGNNEETLKKQGWNKHSGDHGKCWNAKM